MWPRPGNSGPIPLSFSDLEEWLRFIEEFNLNLLVPRAMADKYLRAQKRYYLGWIDYDCIKAGELAALVALELALIGSLIAYMVENDGRTDDHLPRFYKYGATRSCITSTRQLKLESQRENCVPP